MPSDFTAQLPLNVFQPGAYSAVNASLLASPNLLVGKPIPMVLGTALGGKPDTPLYFGSPSLLSSVLRGGVAYDVARFCFDGGASQVGVTRVGNSVTQGTLTLAGTAGIVATLTSKDYGTWVNSIMVSVAAGPIITLTYTDTLGNLYLETWNLTGVGTITGAVVAAAINGGLYGFNASNFVTAAAGVGTVPMTVVSNAPLTGGTDGLIPVTGDWTNGLAAIETEPIDIVLVATGTASIHAQALTHCQNMSAPAARHERVLVCGGVLGESVTTVIARMPSLASARAELVYPGMYDFNAAGALTEYDPFYVAGKIAGMWSAATDPATSLIHQSVPIVQAEVNLSTAQGGALDQLLQAGVTPIAPQPGGGYWVVDALTGYDLPDGTFRDMVKTRSADYVAQYARAQLEQQFVGAKNLLSSQSSIQQAALNICDTLSTQQIIEQYLTPIVNAGPTRNSWMVGLPVMLIDTNKFIFITVGLQPSSTLAGSTTTQDLG